jgi:hypothetical protein
MSTNLECPGWPFQNIWLKQSVVLEYTGNECRSLDFSPAITIGQGAPRTVPLDKTK